MKKTNPIIPAMICSIVLFTLFEIWHLNFQNIKTEKDNFVTSSPIFEKYVKNKYLHDGLVNASSQNPYIPALLSSQWSFVFVGFTSCPDVCPTTLNVMSQTFKELKKTSDNYQGIFVSVDYDNENQSSITQYASSFHPKILGLTYSKKETDQFVHWLGASYKKTGRLISHSTSIFLINPNGELIGEFVNPINAKKIAKKFLNLSKKTVPSLSIKNFKITAPRKGSNVLAGFLDITNSSKNDITINEIHCPFAESTEIHNVVMDQQSRTMSMVKIDKLNIPSGETVRLQPRKKHLMIFLENQSNLPAKLNCYVKTADHTIAILGAIDDKS